MRFHEFMDQFLHITSLKLEDYIIVKKSEVH